MLNKFGQCVDSLGMRTQYNCGTNQKCPYPGDTCEYFTSFYGGIEFSSIGANSKGVGVIYQIQEEKSK